MASTRGKEEGGLGGGLVAGIVAGGVFILFWLLLDLPLAVSLGAGLVSMGASLAIVLGLRKDRAKPEAAIGEYVDADLARKVVAKARADATSLRARAQTMEAGSIRTKFQKLAEGLDKIGADVALDPKDALAASIFISNNGEAALRMASIYQRLRKDGLAQGDNKATLAKLDGVLDRMVATTELELSKLQADEWEALRTEIDFMDAESSLGLEKPSGTSLGGV